MPVHLLFYFIACVYEAHGYSSLTMQLLVILVKGRLLATVLSSNIWLSLVLWQDTKIQRLYSGATQVRAFILHPTVTCMMEKKEDLEEKGQKIICETSACIQKRKSRSDGPSFRQFSKIASHLCKKWPASTQNKIKTSFHVLLFIGMIYNIIKVYISKAQDYINITKVNSVCFCVAVGFICPNIWDLD